jgi:hypothetical protein
MQYKPDILISPSQTHSKIKSAILNVQPHYTISSTRNIPQRDLFLSTNLNMRPTVPNDVLSVSPTNAKKARHERHSSSTPVIIPQNILKNKYPSIIVDQVPQAPHSVHRTWSAITTRNSLYSQVPPHVLQWREKIAKQDLHLIVTTNCGTENKFRMCSPSNVPGFPLTDGELRCSDSMYEHSGYLITEIRTMLNIRGIAFETVTARMRHELGAKPKDSDQTILIIASRRADSAWRMFLHDVVERVSLHQLGLRWRIEFIDPLAIGGKQDSSTIPSPISHVTEHFERFWHEKIQPHILGAAEDREYSEVKKPESPLPGCILNRETGSGSAKQNQDWNGGWLVLN